MRQVTLKKQGGWAWLAAAIPAAASLIGGMLGQREQRISNELTQQQIDLQKDAMLHGVQYRVEDAAMSGVSPLAALGAQTFSPSPVSVMRANPMGDAIERAGQSVGSYLSTQQTDNQKAAEQLDLQLKASQLQTDEVMRMKLSSEAALARQRAYQDNGQGLGPGSVVQVGSTGSPVNQRGSLDWVELKAPEQDIRASEDSSRQAGVNPMWSKVEVSPGSYMLLPTERVSQQWQDMPVWASALTGLKNFEYRYLKAMKEKKAAEARGEWWNQRAGRAAKEWLFKHGISW